MGRHRSRLEIVKEILSTISREKGAKRTKIMYKAYLSYKLLVRYLNDIVGAGLVVCEEDKCYVLTEKGEKFLARFDDYLRFRERVDKQLDRVEDEKSALQEIFLGKNSE